MARTAFAYLRLFKPNGGTLRLPRAIAVLAELDEMVNAAQVSAGGHGGARRAATPAMWAAGMEQMLNSRADLDLPLGDHGHLRTLVYALAGMPTAHAERIGEQGDDVGHKRAVTGTGVSPPQPPEEPLKRDLTWLQQQFEYGAITEQERDERQAAARAKYARAS
ncbi:hypothetical protein L2Y94_06530 [Luteibacter aegosomatis]|uniref:hypothetical protein n=1 Tax=Luteibacter aegosomatis TaxID=2911537 RepID=UPI001FFA6A9B|nr:hypothetical protein [Luteibacter aegosomatis]UPG87007.1 hypothetical protein L2Y94_06530 [Luteibacter aegosomatis]